MKKLAKKAAVIMSTSLLAISLTAGLSAAVDKLVVQDGSANTVFSVDDLGAVKATSSATVVGPNDYTYMGQSAYSDTNWAGGFFIASRARGTEAAPAAVQLSDTIFTFDAQGWDGSAWARGGQIMGKVDGPVGPGKIPFYWTFRTMGNDGVLGDRLTIKADGDIAMPKLAKTYVNGSAYVCVNNSGQIFASETACP